MASRKMTSRELAVAIGRQINAATGAIGDDVSKDRSDLFERYMGEPYGDEVDDRSKVVDTSIADTIEWIMPELMEIFTAGDRVVDFEPLGPDDEARADQEADVVNHVFMRKNDGFLILYSFFKDALIQKVGYAKRWWDEREVSRVEEYEGLTREELAQLLMQWQQEGAEVEIEHAELDEIDGIAIKVRLTVKEEGLKVAPVPPEELIVSPRHNSVFLDDAPFVAHRRQVTVSDLIEAGYDRKQVLDLAPGEDDDFGEVRIDRFDTEDGEEGAEGEPVDPSMREITVHECYLRVDYDGDGVAELRKVTVGGDGHKLLKWAEGGEDNEEVECVPFSALTPIIVPHRHFGRSVAELVNDLQRIKTVLLRQMLDNIYLTNNPTREIAEDGIGETTIEDLLVERPGKIVRTAMPGMYQEHTPPQFMHQMLPALEYVDTVRENRTGVTRYNQGLDANSLNKTATGIRDILSASQKKIALIARIFAETGVKHLFRGIHADLRRNATKAMTIRLRGEYVEVDPRHWKNRADLAVNVALGTGNRDQMLQRLMLIAEQQKEALLAGAPLVTMKNMHHTLTQIVEKAGFKNPDAFWTDPAKAPPQAQRPDPAMAQVEMLAQVEREKAQLQAQVDIEKAKATAQLDLEKMNRQQQMDIAKLRMEDDRERDKMNMEWAIKLRDISAKTGAAITMAEIKAEAQAAAAANRPGPNDA